MTFTVLTVTVPSQDGGQALRSNLILELGRRRGEGKRGRGKRAFCCDGKARLREARRVRGDGGGGGGRRLAPHVCLQREMRHQLLVRGFARAQRLHLCEILRRDTPAPHLTRPLSTIDPRLPAQSANPNPGWVGRQLGRPSSCAGCRVAQPCTEPFRVQLGFPLRPPSRVLHSSWRPNASATYRHRSAHSGTQARLTLWRRWLLGGEAAWGLRSGGAAAAVEREGRVALHTD